MERSVSPNVALNYDVGNNGFTFHKRNERIDWKKLASIDIEKLSQDLDFHILQDNIVHVTFCNIEHEVDRRTVDANYIKLFKLAQFTIEYLLHSQEYLANVIQSLEEKLKEALEKLDEEKIARSKEQKLITDLKKENKKRKRQLASQQQYFESLNKQYAQCSYCPKTFIGPSFLQSHVIRRHPEFAKDVQITHNTQSTESKEHHSTNAIVALEKELRDIKEKMKTTTTVYELNEEKTVSDGNKINDANYKEREEENILRLEEWKKDQTNKHKNELESVKNILMKKLNEMQLKHQESENALKELQEKYSQVNQAYLRSVEKDQLYTQASLEKRQEVESLKEHLKAQLINVEADVQKKLKKQEKEWQMKMKQLTEEYSAEIEKLNYALNESITQLRMEQEKKGFNGNQHEEKIRKLINKSRKQEQLIQMQGEKLKEISMKQMDNLQSPKKSPMDNLQSPKKNPMDNLQSPKKSQMDDLQSPTKSPMDNLQSPKKSPPPPPPRTYMLAETSKSPVIERKEIRTEKSPRLKSALQSSPDLLKGLRTELQGLLEDKLQSYGINPSLTAINNGSFNKISELVKADRNILCKKYRGFSNTREFFEKLLEVTAKETIKSHSANTFGKSSPEQSNFLKRIFNSSKTKDDSSPKFMRSFESKSAKPLSKLLESSQDPITEKTESPKTTCKKNKPVLNPSHQRSPILEESSSDDEISDDTSTKESKIIAVKETQKFTPQPAIRKSVSSLLETKKVSFNDGKISSSEDSSEDSSESDEEDDVLEEYHPIRVKPPTGEHVTKLTQSIEHQLMGRTTKLPVGAVDVMSEIPLKGSTKQTDNNFLKVDDEDDDDDFSLSSVEDELKTFQTQVEMYKSPVKSLQSGKNQAWNSTPKDGKLKVPEFKISENVKPVSSWDSEDDFSVEEIK